MADWQPGDLALCVRIGKIDCPHIGAVHCGEVCPPRGAIREVLFIRAAKVGDDWENPDTPCGCLELNFTDGSRAVAQRCRKIHPHTEDEEDRETIRLLTGKPQPVEA